MLDWILERLPVVVFVVVVIAQIVRGFLRSRDERSTPPARHDELEQDRRTRDIQEEIRRKIAERRGARQAEPARREMEEGQAEPPVVMRRDPTAIPDVPEPLRRMLEQLEKKVQPRAEPVAEPPPLVDRSRAEFERQQRLAEEIRALEEAKAVAARRAANIAAAKAEEARSAEALRSAARGRMLDDLRDPESLRRAFVLREVLGPPVGLR